MAYEETWKPRCLAQDRIVLAMQALASFVAPKGAGNVRPRALYEGERWY